MDIKKYIESGILEEYVLGHKPDPEIEELARRYPEIQQEIETIESVLEAYALSQSISPPAGILEDLLNLTDFEEDDEPNQ